MTTGAELAELAHPQPVAQPGSPFGELDGGALARGQADFGGEKFFLGPILTWIFAIGQTSDALVLHLGQEGGAVAFTIEHHRKAMQQRIGVELFGARVPLG